MATIFLEENDRRACELLELMLQIRGHDVPLVAFSLEEALQKTQEVKDRGIKVIILDGNLGTSEQDGEKVAAHYREKVQGVRILSLSGEKRTYGDVNCTKPFTIGGLNRAIGRLLQLEVA